jgi:hypothetical protein
MCALLVLFLQGEFEMQSCVGMRCLNCVTKHEPESYMVWGGPLTLSAAPLRVIPGQNAAFAIATVLKITNIDGTADGINPPLTDDFKQVAKELVGLVVGPLEVGIPFRVRDSFAVEEHVAMKFGHPIFLQYRSPVLIENIPLPRRSSISGDNTIGRPIVSATFICQHELSQGHD